MKSTPWSGFHKDKKLDSRPFTLYPKLLRSFLRRKWVCLAHIVFMKLTPGLSECPKPDDFTRHEDRPKVICIEVDKGVGIGIVEVLPPRRERKALCWTQRVSAIRTSMDFRHSITLQFPNSLDFKHCLKSKSSVLNTCLCLKSEL